MRPALKPILLRRPSLWTPAQLGSDLALWLDAADASTITLNGSNVSQWSDKSGNGRHATQNTAAAQPTFSSGQVQFNGSQWMTFTGVHNAQWSSAVVGKATEQGSGFYQTGAVNTNGSLFSENSQFIARPAGNPAQDAKFTPTSFNTSIILTAVYGLNLVTGIRLWGNGIIGTPTNGGGVPINAESTLGGLSPTIYRLTGYTQEIIFCNGEWTDYTRQKLEGYLAHKWGLAANLPADHPYRYNAPRA